MYLAQPFIMIQPGRELYGMHFVQVHFIITAFNDAVAHNQGAGVNT